MNAGGDVAGRMRIDDVLVEYRARRLRDGSVNVGTMFPVGPMKRPLTNGERALVARIGEKLGGNEGAQLLADLENASAVTATEDGSRIQFEIRGYDRPPYKGQHPFGVEGKVQDEDGAELSVLLHADENGRLFELEFIRWGEGDLINPDWDTLQLY